MKESWARIIEREKIRFVMFYTPQMQVFTMTESFKKANFKNLINTRGSLRWLKKSSKEVLTREGICMRFWDGQTSNWLKISITCQNSEMAHRFRLETLRWLKNRSNLYLEFSFFSNFELSQSFRSEKSELSRSFDTWSRFWANLKLSLLEISCIVLHVTTPPSMTFWVVSKYNLTQFSLTVYFYVQKPSSFDLIGSLLFSFRDRILPFLKIVRINSFGRSFFYFSTVHFRSFGLSI